MRCSNQHMISNVEAITLETSGLRSAFDVVFAAEQRSRYQPRCASRLSGYPLLQIEAYNREGLSPYVADTMLLVYQKHPVCLTDTNKELKYANRCHVPCIRQLSYTFNQYFDAVAQLCSAGSETQKRGTSTRSRQSQCA